MTFSGASLVATAALVACATNNPVAPITHVLPEVRPAVPQTKLTATPAKATTQFFTIVDESELPPTYPTQVTRAVARTVSTSGFDGLTGLRWTYFNSRPDQSIAAGPGGLLQMVNGGFVALYDRSGNLCSGWPKDAGQFFGLPKGSPFVDHRAAYDLWSKRYWLISGDARSPLVYIAVSQSANPNGKWNVYGLDVSPSTKKHWDFNMFGLDRDTVSYSTDLFAESGNRAIDFTNAVYVIPKAPMVRGIKSVTGRGFTNIVVNGKAPVAIQPILVNPYAGTLPPGELFLATPDTSPCNGSKLGCRDMYAFLIAHGKLTVTRISTPGISDSPLADTPACHRCLDVSGIFMSTGGVYYRGAVYFAFGVGVPNYSTGIPGIFWGELRPQFSGTTLSSAALIQHGAVSFGGRRGAFLPSVMVDTYGNLFLVFDSSGPTLNPSIYVAARRSGDALGKLTSMKLVKRGAAPPPTTWFKYKFFPYGDYTAASFDPNTGVWFSSQYAESPEYYGDYIANVHL